MLPSFGCRPGVVIVSVLILFSCVASATVSERLQLTDGWQIQSGCKAPEPGDVISSTAYHPRGWVATTVPSTVLAALVQAKVYPDPYYGMNLRAIPGTTYPINKLFSRLPMPDDSPYNCAWWYRTEFNLPATYKGKAIWLNFAGINYRANIWLNGKQIANSDDVAGAYRTYEFDVSPWVRPGKLNVLAVQVFAPTEKDLAINWVDWSPTPPDKNMGLWREVYLTSAGPVAIKVPQVVSKVDGTSASAELTLTAELRNTTNHAVQGELEARIENVRLSQTVELAGNETRVVTFAPEEFPQLKFTHPRLWWPYQMGKPELYTMEMRFLAGGRLSDAQNVRFGIRQVTSEFTDKGYRLFRINGKRILIRGGGWAPDMLLRFSPERDEEEMRYVRDLNLNTIRLEGKLESDHFYDLADRYGILIMPGWCCCDIWEKWNDWPAQNRKVAVESLRSQALRMRNHPSIFVWLNGSDFPPVAEVEQAYLDVLKQTNWPNPIVSSATQAPTTVTGPSGVKMTGPYDWIPPSYWLTDTKHGGAYGFNTETGPGPSIPTAESLKRFIPKEHLWPIDEHWTYHAGLGGFTNIDVFREAMDARYGPSGNFAHFVTHAQAMAYDGERAMFEAYSRNKYTSTGVIQWMLNKSWPSLIWQLYDYYLMPNGAYFGAKKALEPLHPQYSYDDRSVYVVNSTYAPAPSLTVSAKVYNFDLSEKYAKEVVLDAAEDSSNRAFELPEMPDLSTTYFVKLDLRNAAGKLLSTNFYWLSTKPDVFDWEKTDYRRTALTQHGDLTMLATLPEVSLKLSSRTEHRPSGSVTHVTVSNPSKSLAFMVHLRLLKGREGQDVLPVVWDDNYFTLMPGEERSISARYGSTGVGKAVPFVSVDGWNVVASGQPTSVKAAGD